MSDYINTLNKTAEFFLINSAFDQNLSLNFPIPNTKNQKEKLVCWYPASGGDLAPLEQDIYLPDGGKMRKVKNFLYVDHNYDFERNSDSGLYSVVYRHNGSLCEGILGRYLGFKCVLHVFEDKTCLFINADIRTFESDLIINNVKIDLVCFVPRGVLFAESPSRLTKMKVSFFLGELSQLYNKVFELEKTDPEMIYLLGGGEYYLQKVIPVQTTPRNLTREERIKVLKSLSEFSDYETLIEIESDVFELLDSRMQEYKGETIKEFLQKIQMGVMQSGNKFTIIDYNN
jgi:hypothetical protein